MDEVEDGGGRLAAVLAVEEGGRTVPEPLATPALITGTPPGTTRRTRGAGRAIPPFAAAFGGLRFDDLTRTPGLLSVLVAREEALELLAADPGLIGSSACSFAVLRCARSVAPREVPLAEMGGREGGGRLKFEGREEGRVDALILEVTDEVDDGGPTKAGRAEIADRIARLGLRGGVALFGNPEVDGIRP
mgnify:FL=1